MVCVAVVSRGQARNNHQTKALNEERHTQEAPSRRHVGQRAARGSGIDDAVLSCRSSQVATTCARTHASTRAIHQRKACAPQPPTHLKPLHGCGKARSRSTWAVVACGRVGTRRWVGAAAASLGVRGWEVHPEGNRRLARVGDARQACGEQFLK